LPLFFPPAARLPEWHPDADWAERLFPTVPAWWVGTRVAALLFAAVWFARSLATLPPEFTAITPAAPPSRTTERAALFSALALLLVAPWVPAMPPLACLFYALVLFLPAACLRAGVPSTRNQSSEPNRHRLLPVAASGAVIAAWLVVALVRERSGLEATRAVDHWRAFVDALLFLAGGGNFLADLYDREIPHLGAVPFLFQGVPFAQVGLGTLSLASVQAHQMCWLAVAAGGLAWLAAKTIAPLAAPFVAASFLASPFTHLMAVAPAPFVFGPVVTVALLAAWLAFTQRHSHAALASAGPLAGLAIHYPSVVPVVAVVGIDFLRRLPPSWATHRASWVTGALALVAAVIPAAPHLFDFSSSGHFLLFHGNAAWLDVALLGQGSVRLMEEGRAVDVRRFTDIVAGALLAPLAHSRLHIRIWGDTIFDPVTSVFFALGWMTCFRFARQSALARALLILWIATLLPSFVSPVDRVDIIHSVSLAVPVALLAALGLGQVLTALPARLTVAVALGAAGASWLSGHTLVHRVNPRILAASAPGLALESLTPGGHDRAVLLDYPARYHADTRWLYVGPMSAYAGGRPAGYFRLPEDHALAVEEFLAAHKDLVFWSPGLEQDFSLARRICADQPSATMFLLHDRAGLGKAWAARLGGAFWEPALPRDRWRAVPCDDVP
jgi:hypothetical protein